MPVFSPFEILFEFLYPTNIPVQAPDPIAVQGYWLQVSLRPDSPVQSLSFDIAFAETTNFNSGAGSKYLQAQFIDANGNVNIYSNFFSSAQPGFLNQVISKGQTLIYGAQCLALKAGAPVAATPQSGTGWRGLVSVTPHGSSGNLICEPTQRLLYLNLSNTGTPAVFGACVYPVATLAGIVV
ncbi:hypothetical protein [uncultured Alsobacter sp.]|uniref:hypothetical protein n=1 Tax=uncultured Alsobacter sp. TaxID=1748258 RepID=UPI0025CE38F9|nr:hypothetical protein [uncultured Alsobacter sp.]